MKPDELFLADLHAPELDATFDARVRAHALATLAAPGEPTRTGGAKWMSALVPALLLSAAVVRLVEVVEVEAQISAPSSSLR